MKDYLITLKVQTDRTKAELSNPMKFQFGAPHKNSKLTVRDVVVSDIKDAARRQVQEALVTLRVTTNLSLNELENSSQYMSSGFFHVVSAKAALIQGESTPAGADANA